MRLTLFMLSCIILLIHSVISVDSYKNRRVTRQTISVRKPFKLYRPRSAQTKIPVAVIYDTEEDNQESAESNANVKSNISQKVFKQYANHPPAAEENNEAPISIETRPQNRNTKKIRKFVPKSARARSLKLPSAPKSEEISTPTPTPTPPPSSPPQQKRIRKVLVKKTRVQAVNNDNTKSVENMAIKNNVETANTNSESKDQLNTDNVIEKVSEVTKIDVSLNNDDESTTYEVTEKVAEVIKIDQSHENDEQLNTYKMSEEVTKITKVDDTQENQDQLSTFEVTKKQTEITETDESPKIDDQIDTYRRIEKVAEVTTLDDISKNNEQSDVYTVTKEDKETAKSSKSPKSRTRQRKRYRLSERREEATNNDYLPRTDDKIYRNRWTKQETESANQYRRFKVNENYENENYEKNTNIDDLRNNNDNVNQNKWTKQEVEVTKINDSGKSSDQLKRYRGTKKQGEVTSTDDSRKNNDKVNKSRWTKQEVVETKDNYSRRSSDEFKRYRVTEEIGAVTKVDESRKNNDQLRNRGTKKEKSVTQIDDSFKSNDQLTRQRIAEKEIKVDNVQNSYDQANRNRGFIKESEVTKIDNSRNSNDQINRRRMTEKEVKVTKVDNLQNSNIQVNRHRGTRKEVEVTNIDYSQKNDDRSRYFERKTQVHEHVVPIISIENRQYSGHYQYGYEGGDGTKAFERGVLKQVDEERSGTGVVGGFSYTDKDGNDFSLSYTADENGYRPVGDHLPTPPPIPIAIQRALAYLATKDPEPVTERIRVAKPVTERIIDSQSTSEVRNKRRRTDSRNGKEQTRNSPQRG